MHIYNLRKKSNKQKTKKQKTKKKKKKRFSNRATSSLPGVHAGGARADVLVVNSSDTDQALDFKQKPIGVLVVRFDRKAFFFFYPTACSFDHCHLIGR